MRRVSSLRVFPARGGERVWREEVNHAPDWTPSPSEKKLGAKVSLPDGIYIVTVSEETPTDWFDLAWKATITAKGQHPEWGFIPMDNYDSAVAVHQGRVVGAAWARTTKQCPFFWNVSFKPNGEPFGDGDFSCAGADNEVGEEKAAEEEAELDVEPRKLVHSDEPGALIPRGSSELFPPMIMTIWVHRAHRRKGIGRQLVAALASHFGLGIDRIGFRLPLWKESVHMVLAMGLKKIVGGF